MSTKKAAVYGLLALLFALHTDVWFWDDGSLVLGAPIGFTYHVLWTLVVTVAFWLVVAWAWPGELATAAAAPDDPRAEPGGEGGE